MGRPLSGLGGGVCDTYSRAVWNHCGIPLSGNVDEQYAACTMSNGQPGSLAFFGVTSGNAGHVGVLVGNGNMVNATADPQGPAGYWAYLDPVQTSVRGTDWAWVEERWTPYLEECDQ